MLLLLTRMMVLVRRLLLLIIIVRRLEVFSLVNHCMVSVVISELTGGLHVGLHLELGIVEFLRTLLYVFVIFPSQKRVDLVQNYLTLQLKLFQRLILFQLNKMHQIESFYNGRQNKIEFDLLQRIQR
jgi:hypothetical protein